MNAEMLKGHLDAVVLAAIEAGATYGYAMIKEIGEKTRGVIDLPEGTIYPTLHRLENNGLIASQWEIAPSGRKRRTYSLTDPGRESLRERCDQWKSFAQAIDLILLGPKARTI